MRRQHPVWVGKLLRGLATRAESEKHYRIQVLREVMELAESAWRRARTQLAELEDLSDRLGDQLTYIDIECPQIAAQPARSVMSAA